MFIHVYPSGLTFNQHTLNVKILEDDFPMLYGTPELVGDPLNVRSTSGKVWVPV